MMNQKCINCQADVQGAYCHACGNPTNNKRLTFKRVFADLYERVFGFDTKFGHTLLNMFSNPGKVILSYINGNKVYYMTPVAYLFWTITVFVVLMSILDIDLSQLASETEKLFGQQKTVKQERFSNEFTSWMSDNFRLISFAFIPIFALAQLLVFRKNKFNYIEHMVVMIYSNAQTMLFNIVSILCLYFFGLHLQNIVLAMAILFFAYVCSSTYTGNKFWNFLKGILAFLLGYFFLILIAFIFVFALVIINPEILK